MLRFMRIILFAVDLMAGVMATVRRGGRTACMCCYRTAGLRSSGTLWRLDGLYANKRFALQREGTLHIATWTENNRRVCLARRHDAAASLVIFEKDCLQRR